ncbi:hypothetical protein B0T17DRAFT_249613 [Bombardia bombarda]|uniref:Cell wall proline rich protein n=1 Tax=Bombardia bombarda TaxID=252184 RepID=A0AA39WZW7_9PEZI|nr:hypothetical protein B0T17DRAFT_249613 [Bombardia bombarda]
MAATIGPDMMVGSPDHFDNATARHLDGPGAVDSMTFQHPLLDGALATPKSNVAPPNPPFVFPRLSSSPSSAPSSFSRATGRRPRSAIETSSPILALASEIDLRKPKSPALPSFSFNPGADLPLPSMPDSTFLSPLQSPAFPASPRSIPPRHGHRRGASEFVGGSIRSGDSITVLSTSPTKSDSGMPSPLLQPKPNQRRGHAHRRSAAISSHDLSSIILPTPGQNLRGSSAPTSPALNRPDHLDFPPPEHSPALSEPIRSSVEVIATRGEDVRRPVREAEQPPKATTRNRVGFSDTLEYIPRPLSLVSSDTSSTATARPGHSVSGSISSVISLNMEREVNSPVGFSAMRMVNETRPSTAGAILERTQSSQEQEQAHTSSRRRGSIPLLGSLPPPTAVDPGTPSPTRSLKKWGFFGLDPFVAASPTRSLPVSVSSSESLPKPQVSTRRSCEKVSTAPVEVTKDDLADMKPLTKKRSKKQKKVKTWSILTRKSKPRHGKHKRRAPTPPLRRDADDVEEETESDGVSKMFAEPEAVMPRLLVTDPSGNGDEEMWHHPGHVSLPDEDSSYQMIDLDVALGPFNTPLPRNPEWEAAQRAGGLIKKQLHSAAGMTRFTGPGMHYHHRRAESAPEMVPFDSARFGFPRFGSNSTMADVFEEDEEDNDDESSDKSTGRSTPVVDVPIAEIPESTTSLGDDSTDSPTTADLTPTEDRVSALLEAKRKDGDLQDGQTQAENVKATSVHSAGSVRGDVMADGHVAWNIADAQGDTPMRNSFSDSATPSPRHCFRPKDLAPVDVSPLNLPPASFAPISPYSMTQSSAFPSPRSPMSYDAHRISTAPSSVTEDNFASLLMGEPGPEVRISVDDIPSLTSSNSTMTRESMFSPNSQARYPPLDEQPRPASFTSTAFGRRRSSLASLSRLISSSHGERSKLSMEVSMDSEPEKKEKVSKKKRISRLVQFWKPKDTNAA